MRSIALEKKGSEILELVLPPGALAQSDDHHKVEFFGGYSLMNFDNAAGNTNNAEVHEVLGSKERMQGLNLSLTGNFNKYVGVKFDYSLHLLEDNFSRPLGSTTTDSSVLNYLGGLQFKNNTEEGPRVKPFAHALFGVVVQKIDFRQSATADGVWRQRLLA